MFLCPIPVFLQHIPEFLCPIPMFLWLIPWSHWYIPTFLWPRDVPAAHPDILPCSIPVFCGTSQHSCSPWRLFCPSQPSSAPSHHFQVCSWAPSQHPCAQSQLSWGSGMFLCPILTFPGSRDIPVPHPSIPRSSLCTLLILLCSTPTFPIPYPNIPVLHPTIPRNGAIPGTPLMPLSPFLSLQWGPPRPLPLWR